MISSLSWKAISGWTNHSCTVISHLMSENEMGYRGSKSKLVKKQKLVTNFVKEQRVDGSWGIRQIPLRYTLMGFERNYQLKIPSCHLNNTKTIYFSTFNLNPKLNPWFLSGLIDGEGSFSTTIQKNKPANQLKLDSK